MIVHQTPTFPFSRSPPLIIICGPPVSEPTSFHPIYHISITNPPCYQELCLCLLCCMIWHINTGFRRAKGPIATEQKKNQGPGSAGGTQLGTGSSGQCHIIIKRKKRKAPKAVGSGKAKGPLWVGVAPAYVEVGPEKSGESALSTHSAL